MKTYTASDLLVISIQLEMAAQELYKAWAKKFAAVSDVASFWSAYAAEEATHARLLEELRARLSPEQLATPVESEMAQDAEKLLISLRTEAEIHDLEQAYQQANYLEHSEANSLFEFIMAHFETDKKAIAFLRSQLDGHIGRLTYRFPEQFSRPELRRAIKV